MSIAIRLMERGALPDSIVRLGIRRLLRQRLRSERELHSPDPAQAKEAFVRRMAQGPIAHVPEKANTQHYELPPSFFGSVLGRHMKYSGCQWEPGCDSLDEAEAAMLALTCERAGIRDGMRVLELGCGWGSLTLWMAERYPRASIRAVSNSAPQREHILARAEERGLRNLTVTTCDMNVFDAEERFDRVVSVEMFEHMRNWPELLRRVESWLEPNGRLFVHVFSHREYAYTFETDGEDDWMGQHFFTGGCMPSHDLMERAVRGLAVEQRWFQEGTHYSRTAEAWLANFDGREEDVLRVLAEAYGDQAQVWAQRWRVFFMACAELFGYRDGKEWGVSHYLLRARVRLAVEDSAGDSDALEAPWSST